MCFLESRDYVNGPVCFKQCLGPLPAVTGLIAYHMQSLKWHKSLSRDSAKQNGDTLLSIQNIHLISVFSYKSCLFRIVKSKENFSIHEFPRLTFFSFNKQPIYLTICLTVHIKIPFKQKHFQVHQPFFFFKTLSAFRQPLDSSWTSTVSLVMDGPVVLHDILSYQSNHLMEAITL